MRKKQTNTVKVMQYIKKNPNAKAKEVSKATGVPVSTVYQTVYLQKKKANDAPTTKVVKRGRPRQIPSTLAPNAVASMALYADDVVNHPSHYKVGGIETIDFIEAKSLNYNLGNVVKYITRAGVKDKAKHIEDLEKGAWYLAREISSLKKGK